MEWRLWELCRYLPQQRFTDALLAPPECYRYCRTVGRKRPGHRVYGRDREDDRCAPPLRGSWCGKPLPHVPNRLDLSTTISSRPEIRAAPLAQRVLCSIQIRRGRGGGTGAL